MSTYLLSAIVYFILVSTWKDAIIKQYIYV